MYKLLLLANGAGDARALMEVIDRAGLSCQVETDLPTEDTEGVAPTPEAVLLDLASIAVPQAQELVGRCREMKIPVVAVVPSDEVANHDPSLNPDEFIFCPVGEGELVARIKQAIYRVNGSEGSQVLRVGELMVDLERYDVTVSGRRVSLTYKEFQLLVLLASNPGRVYTREALLSQIWGYDYLGGTRTVDVHIRRLRSKIEAPGRSFIETIWNVGYRFNNTAH